MASTLPTSVEPRCNRDRLTAEVGQLEGRVDAMKSMSLITSAPSGVQPVDGALQSYRDPPTGSTNFALCQLVRGSGTYFRVRTAPQYTHRPAGL